MSDETISPLSRRMIEDMTVRNFSADTQRNYIRGVKNLAIFLVFCPVDSEQSRWSLARMESAVAVQTKGLQVWL
jgi:hypothetical protein